MSFYIASAQTSTAVSHVQVGSFIDETHINVILGTTSAIQVHRFSSEQVLEAEFQLPIYGRIAALKLFSLPSYPRDLLIVLTQRLQFAILSFDPKSQSVQTICSGSASATSRSSPGSRRSEAGTLALIEPEGRCIALHSFAGLLKIIPISPKDEFGDAFVIRIDEFHILDICFLEGHRHPAIAILFQDPGELRHVKVYHLSIEDEDVSMAWEHHEIDDLARKIIPVPGGGLIVLGDESVAFYDGNSAVALEKSGAVPTAFTRIDAGRYLIGDLDGSLNLLQLSWDPSPSLSIQALGQISIPSALEYIDAGCVFVASSHSDSQLIMLSSNSPNVRVLREMPGIAPIADFAEGVEGEIVCCSGLVSQGSLRVARRGKGVLTHAAVGCDAISNIFYLPGHMVLSSFYNSVTLALTEEKDKVTVQRALSTSITESKQTIWCGPVSNQTFGIVTFDEIRLIDDNLELLDSFFLEDPVYAASGNCGKIIVAHQRNVELIEIQRSGMESTLRFDFEEDVSCVFLHEKYVLVGLWNGTVEVLDSSTLTYCFTIDLDGKLPRAVSLVSFGDTGKLFALCACGQGSLISCEIIESGLTGIHERSLGSIPLSLQVLPHNAVFVGGERPIVLSLSNRGEIEVAATNLHNVSAAVVLEQLSLVAFVSENTLSMGELDLQPQLHIRKISLGEQPRRIVHAAEDSCFAVTTQASAPLEQNFLRLFDDRSFDILESFELQKYELCCSLFRSEKGFILLGTAFALPDETEPSQGRLLVFSIDGRRLTLVAEQVLGGALYSIGTLSRGEIVCSVNSSVEVYRLHENFSLQRLSCTHGHIMALYVKTRGDVVLVGDLMRSLNVYVWDPVEEILKESARDYEPRWTVACEVIDDTHFLGAESSYNFWVLRRNIDAADAFERMRLTTIAKFHLGEFVNVIREGSFIDPKELSLVNPRWIYATVSGSLGVIVPISDGQYSMLLQLQQRLDQTVFGIGNLSFSSWRSYWNENQFEETSSKGFIDGDFIETFLDLDEMRQKEIAVAIDVNIEELVDLVSQLSRCH